MNARRVIGVLGGMGPLATVDLYRKIIEATPARRDQDHLHVIIEGDPSVPDRTEALLRNGLDPTPYLVAGARRLESAGTDFIVMPCNTAHAFLPRVQAEVSIPFLSMIDETARAVAAIVSPGATVGILATAGTIASGLYQQAFEMEGIRAVTPGVDAQANISQAIAAVKAGRTGRATSDLVLAASREMIQVGVHALVAACTELPIVLQQEDVPVALIDPTKILAEAAVREAILAGKAAGRIPGAAADADRA